MKTAVSIEHRYHGLLPFDTHTLSIIDDALGSEDRCTQEHAHRVALYAMRLASRVGLTAQQAQQIAIGGLLHDVGKIGMNKRIFNNKCQQLGKEMREEMQQHPHVGATFLESIGMLPPVPEYVHCHHERMDGTGYPRGLTADNIPLGAKIISVVDCFDAITSDRPYQRRKSQRQAFRILRQLSGSSLQPSLVEMFIAEVEQSGMIPDGQADFFSALPPYPIASGKHPDGAIGHYSPPISF